MKCSTVALAFANIMMGIEETQFIEPPATPAPVFALRALKTALFGTPVTPEVSKRRDDGRVKIENEREEQQEHITVPGPILDFDNVALPMPSPTKGILLTPGTVTRRKTVSFGKTVIDEGRTNIQRGHGKSGIPADCPGKFPSPWTPKAVDALPRKQSRLTRSFLEARDEHGELESNHKRIRSSSGEEEMDSPFVSPSKRSPKAGDDTADLNDPRSQAGRYWKSEFEQFRRNTNRETRKLVQYRQAAKSYARRKDAEVTSLTSRLRDEQMKVRSLEEKISSFGAKFAPANSRDTHKVVESTTGASQKTSSGAKEHQIQASDLERLQNAARDAEKKASEAQRENLALKRSLTRIKKELSSYEGRRLAKEERLTARAQRLEQHNSSYKSTIAILKKEQRERERLNEEQTKQLRYELYALKSKQRQGGNSEDENGARGRHMERSTDATIQKTVEEPPPADEDCDQQINLQRARQKRSYEKEETTRQTELEPLDLDLPSLEPSAMDFDPWAPQPGGYGSRRAQSHPMTPKPPSSHPNEEKASSNNGDTASRSQKRTVQNRWLDSTALQDSRASSLASRRSRDPMPPDRKAIARANLERRQAARRTPLQTSRVASI